MEIYIAYVLREEYLILLMHRHRGIFPPQKRMSGIGTVIKPHTGLKPLFAGAKNYTYHTLHTVNRVTLRKMANGRAVG